ncbi:DUF695 domain-containing protein [Undibacterium luofuense]|uniref:DUF695 domain-containing protein n=1 Tax=Undibacterium luofuense TaxID=2828733 RepID=A0A941DIJ0_9BURK|nr:DUF695 domain-containing protein [Undibacterium luofuense]MBR7781577.1 DUF695 domain-containing protein [Undibacterium luofuense]
MQEQWDFYFCRVDDAPASINLNLALAQTAPLEECAVMAWVSLEMRAPREDGFSSAEEYPVLEQLEDALMRGLGVGNATTPDAGPLMFVGRNTSAGRRDFYFYTGSGYAWQNRVAAALKAFPDYRFETGTQDDPEWQTYFEFLYPGEDDLQRMQNRRVCQQLEQHGDPLTQERPLYHWVYFATADARAAYIDQILQNEFEIEQEWEADTDEYRFGLQFCQTSLPHYRTIDSITLPLFFAARDYNGHYDGWETEVIAPDQTH